MTKRMRSRQQDSGRVTGYSELILLVSRSLVSRVSKHSSHVTVMWVCVISRRIGANYAATLDEPIRREAAAGACFSFSQAATSSGSKRTDPEIRNDGILPLAAIL